MARIFAYIAHKGGVADDTAGELLAAAKQDRPGAISDRRCHRMGRGAGCCVRGAAGFL